MTMTANEVALLIDSVRGETGIVVCTMGAMNALDALPLSPLTVACVPLMGGAASLGLGLALAQPMRAVFVLDGDASLLMELGGLVSIADAAPGNLHHILFNNRVQFAGLGNLPTPGSRTVDFAGMAQAAGYASTFKFDSRDAFAEHLESSLEQTGPSFVELLVETAPGVLGKARPSVEMTDTRFTRMGDELRRIRGLVATA